MTTRFCRDCANFEERRDIDGTVLCTENMRPCICCEEFEPKYRETNWNRIIDRFCVECASFENINGIVLCSKNHAPDVACRGFKNILRTRMNNHLKTALTCHTLNAKSEESTCQILHLKPQEEPNRSRFS